MQENTARDFDSGSVSHKFTAQRHPVGGKMYFCGGKALVLACPSCVCSKIEDDYQSGKSAERS